MDLGLARLDTRRRAVLRRAALLEPSGRHRRAGADATPSPRRRSVGRSAPPARRSRARRTRRRRPGRASTRSPSRSSAGVAVLTLAETQADLGIAVLVVSHPGSMPANLTRDVEKFAAGGGAEAHRGRRRGGSVDVSDAQRPVLEFLHQQAQIRAELPLRELHICRSCRLEKITNPEYERIAARNEKIGDIVAGVGATISQRRDLADLRPGPGVQAQAARPGVRLLALPGHGGGREDRHVLPELRRSPAGRGPAPLPEVRVRLPRQSCRDANLGGARRAGAPTARTCRDRRCAGRARGLPVAGRGLRRATRAGGGHSTRVAAPAGGVAPARADSPRQSAVGRHGKVCQMCGREFATLWRVVISTPAGYEERFVCGTSFACRLPTVIAAIPV